MSSAKASNPMPLGWAVKTPLFMRAAGIPGLASQLAPSARCRSSSPMRERSASDMHTSSPRPSATTRSISPALTPRDHRTDRSLLVSRGNLTAQPEWQTVRYRHVRDRRCAPDRALAVVIAEASDQIRRSALRQIEAVPRARGSLSHEFSERISLMNRISPA